MAFSLKRFTFLFLFKIALTIGATPQSLQILKKSLKNQEKGLEKISNEIASLEKNLEKKNNEIINIIQKKQEISDLITKVAIDGQEKERKLHSLYETLKKNYLGLMLNSMDPNERPDKILSHKLLMKNAKNEIRKYKETEKLLKNLKIQINGLQEKFQDYIKNEKILSELLQDLEKKKKNYADQYLTEIKKKESIEERYKKIKTKFDFNEKRKIEPVEKTFILPLRSYEKFDYAKRGMTFYFTKQDPVFSSQEGNIVHVGELSKYGNVIMIDHGNHLRSILLGRMIPKVKKGQKVKKGHLLGYTTPLAQSRLNEQKIYFEIRKRNKVQNTMLYIASDSLAFKK